METNSTNKQPALDRIADALESIALSLEVRTLKRMPSTGFSTTTYYLACVSLPV